MNRKRWHRRLSGGLVCTAGLFFLLPGVPFLASAEDLVAQPGISAASNQLSGVDLGRAEGRVADFSGRTHTRWNVLDWSPSSLTPRLAVGTGLDLGRPVSDAATAEMLARDLVTAHPDLFQTEPARLAVFDTGHGLGKWSVHFWETIDGMPVLGSKVTSVITEAGELAAFGVSTFPMIREAAAPVLSANDAVARAYDHLLALGLVTVSRDQLSIATEGPYVLPVLDPAGTPAPGTYGITGHTIWRARLTASARIAPTAPASYEVDVDAVSGEVLQRRDVLRHLDFTGTISAEVQNPNYCSGSEIDPLSFFEVFISGAGTAQTGTDGTFTVPYAGSGPETMIIKLRGAYVDLFNVDGPFSTISQEVTPGTPIEVTWDDVSARQDERDVFFHTTATHEMLKSVHPGWTDLDFPLPANVNINSPCNAFWDGESINFFRAAGGCGNTGEIGDVIAHEYGHGVTDFLYGPNDPAGDLHEGNSDVHGNYLTNGSIVGPGFTQDDCDSGIRDSNNELVWPDDLVGEGHFDGQIIAGFHWEIRRDLMTQMGEEAGHMRALEIWHFARVLGLPQTQPEQAWYTMIADDDNANLDDGTPNFEVICAAAVHKGYECPETFTDVVIRHTPLPYGGALTGNLSIVAEMYSLAGSLVANELHWRMNGQGDPFQTLSMSSIGGNDFEALIADPPVGSSIDYYLTAEDEFGNVLQRPADPGDFYTMHVVSVYHNAETADGWTVGAPGDDATTGVWEQVDPNRVLIGPFLCQPEDDTSPDPGSLAWITGQFEGGSPILTDADGQTTLLSPVYDLTGSAWGYVQFDRWFQSLFGALGVLDFDVTYNGGLSWNRLFRWQASQSVGAWQTVTKTLNPLGPLGEVRFRLVMFGEANPSLDEGGLDEFILVTGTSGGPSSTEDPTIAAQLGLTLRSPNPTSGIARVEYRLPEAGPVTLAIFSSDGRQLRTLVRGHVDAGVHEVSWDGLDEAGRKAASGVYFAQVTTAQGSQHGRIVITR